MFLEQNLSPRGEVQPYIWVAKYKDGTMLTEFNDDGTENKFTDIKRDEIDTFGLMGRGLYLFYTAKDGVFDIHGNTLTYHIRLEDGTIIPLAEKEGFSYNDPINFKGLCADFTPNFTNAGHMIFEYLFGYKGNYELEEDKKLYFKTIFKLPIAKTMEFGFNITSEKDIKGDLVIIKNGKEDKVFPIDIRYGNSVTHTIFFTI